MASGQAYTNAVQHFFQQWQAGNGQGPAGGLAEAREAARRPGRPGQGRRRGAVSARLDAATQAPGRPAAAPALRTRARRRADWRRRRLVLLLMSPWIVGFSVFFGYPLVMSAYLSFNHYDLLSSPRWVGWANYHYLLPRRSAVLGRGARTRSGWSRSPCRCQVLFAFGIALLLARAKSGAGLLPHGLLPARARAAGRRDARLRLHPQPGDRPGEHASSKLGIEGPLWFNSPQWAKPSLILLSLWGIGNTMVIFLAAVLDVPQHLYESAELDGAGPLQRLRWVTLPTVSPVILFAVVLGVIQGLQYFTQAYVAAASRPARRRRPATRSAASATRTTRRSSIRCCSTSTGSTTSRWATRRRWRCCCSSCRSP